MDQYDVMYIDDGRNADHRRPTQRPTPSANRAVVVPPSQRPTVIYSRPNTPATGYGTAYAAPYNTPQVFVGPPTSFASRFGMSTGELIDTAIIKDAPAAAYADLMIALGRAGVPTTSHRNGSALRGARRRVAQSADSVNLPEFASFVLALADQIDEDRGPDRGARGRFGRKVFIAAIRRALRGTQYARLPRAAVDELLVRAHRAGLLELARADLVAAMDTDEIRDSEIVVPNAGATFHFVVAERGRNATTYHQFALRTYPAGRHGQATQRWFHAETPTTWTNARDRLIEAGIAAPDLGGRTHVPGGWMLSVDPADYRADRAEPLPGGTESQGA